MARKSKTEAAVPQPVPPEMLNVVTRGDCLSLLPLLPDESVDLIFADPPYNIGVKYDRFNDAQDPPAYLSWAALWLGECARVLKPKGNFWLAASEEFVSELKVLTEGWFSLRHWLSDAPIARLGAKLYQRHHVIWYYTFGVNCPRKLTRSHTHLLHFVKDREEHVWHAEDVRVPSARQLEYNDKRASPAGRLPDDTWIIRPKALVDGFQAAGHDVWHEHRVCGNYKERSDTPNQMPEQLLGRILRLSSNPGDVVLDPFCGSGTTACVATKLERKFVTFELSETYADLACTRLATTAAGQMLDGYDAVATTQ